MAGPDRERVPARVHSGFRSPDGSSSERLARVAGPVEELGGRGDRRFGVGDVHVCGPERTAVVATFLRSGVARGEPWDPPSRPGFRVPAIAEAYAAPGGLCGLLPRALTQ